MCPSDRGIRQIVSVWATGLLWQACQDPNQFCRKVTEKVRQRFPKVSAILFPLQKRLQKSRRGGARALADAGEYSQAIEALDRLPKWKRIVYIAFREKIEGERSLLYQEFQSSEPVEVRRPTRVLYFLNNSLPFTQSGYTIRTQKMMTSLRQSGQDIIGMTRIGYPWVIGSLTKTTSSNVDGNRYLRSLPSVLPRSEQTRQEAAVDLLVAAAKEQKATALHTTTPFTNALVVSRAAKILGVPWIYEARGEPENTWLSRFPEQERHKRAKSEYYLGMHSQELEAMKSADAVVALSQVSKDKMVDRGIDPKKVTVVPNAMDDFSSTDDLRPGVLREKLGISEDTKVIGVISSLVAYEGIDDLIKSLEYLDSSVVLVIVGDGVERPYLEELTEELGLEQRVYFVGRKPHSEVREWYAMLDAFAVPRKDQMVCRNVTPIKPLMAMSLSVPIVASDLPALREITAGAAYYSRPEDPSSIAAAIAEALSREMTLTPAIRDFLREHTWEHNAEKMKILYTRLGGAGES